MKKINNIKFSKSSSWLFFKTKKNNFKSGFTLIEFIIVMAIIGILVLMASPKFLNYVDKAKKTQIINDERLVHQEIQLQKTKAIANNQQVELFDEDGRVLPPVMSRINTKLNKDEFFFNEDEDKVHYQGKGSIYHDNLPVLKEPTEKEFNKAKEIFKYEENAEKEITILGITEEYKNKGIDIGLMADLQYDGRRIVTIGNTNSINGIFYNRQIYGELPYMPKLREITNQTFNTRYAQKISGKIPPMPELKTIGNYAFQNTDIEDFSDMPKLEEVGDWAFQNTKNLKADIDNIKNVKTIGSYAFNESNVKGNLKNFKNLTIVGAYAFKNVEDISGSLSNLNNLEKIMSEAFLNTSISEVSNLPKLTFIGEKAFIGTKVKKVDNLPILNEIGYSAFEGVESLTQLSNISNITKIGSSAFEGTNIEGPLTSIPKLERMNNYVFKNTNISGQLPEIPKLRTIPYSAFEGTKLDETQDNYPGWNLAAGGFWKK